MLSYRTLGATFFYRPWRAVISIQLFSWRAWLCNLLLLLLKIRKCRFYQLVFLLDIYFLWVGDIQVRINNIKITNIRLLIPPCLIYILLISIHSCIPIFNHSCLCPFIKILQTMLSKWLGLLHTRSSDWWWHYSFHLSPTSRHKVLLVNIVIIALPHSILFLSIS